MSNELRHIILVLFLAGYCSVGTAQFDGEGDVTSSGSATSDEGEAIPQTKLSVDKKDIQALAEARKNKNERQMVDAASRILGADSTHLLALNSLAVFHLERGQTGLAKIILQRALKAHPQTAALHNNLGVVYLAEGKLRQALGSFRKSLEVESSYRVGAANLGAIMAEYGDYKNALAPLSAGYKAVRSQLKSGDQGAIEVANNYAVALAGVGEFKEARDIYEEIVEGSGRNAFVLMNYAVLLVEKLKDYKAGGKLISRIKFAVDEPQVLRRVARLEKLIEEKGNEK